MSEVDRIVGLLSSDVVEKRIAAVIVLGELRPKGAPIVDALAKTLSSGIPALQRHALDALGRLGAKRAAREIEPLLGVRDDDVRRAAVAAMVSIGDDVLPRVRAKMTEPAPEGPPSPSVGAWSKVEERRSIDAILAALGGRDAFHTLLEGLAAGDVEAAKAAAIAVRQQIRDADGRQRRSYLAETEKFLERVGNRGGSSGALAAGIKILGYLEDRRALPTLLAFAKASVHPPAVRQEALIALRFLMAESGTEDRSREKATIATLIEAAEDADRTIAQTALHTLGSLRLPAGVDVMKPLQKLVSHPDFERARFVIEMLGRMPGAEPARALVSVLANTKDKRRAELAAASLTEGRSVGANVAPGSSPIRDEAVPILAKALLESPDADRAWLLRAVMRPSARKISPTIRREMLDTACRRLSSEQGGWEPLLAAARDADAPAAAQALRDLAGRLKKANPTKAAAVLRVLCHGEGSTDEDRYALAVVELARGARDTRPAARAGDQSLRMLGTLLGRGVDVASHLKKDRSLDLTHLYYVGFHFAEEGDPVGEELLKTVVEKGGRAKIAKMARSKLALGES